MLSEMCKLRKQYGMYLSWDPNLDVEELHGACPILSKDILALYDSYAYMFFDTEKEMQDNFNRVVGEDGPTALNAYDGEATVYAMTCDNKGELMTVNT